MSARGGQRRGPRLLRRRRHPEMKGLDNPEAVFDFYNVAGIFMKKMINFVKPTITVAHGAIAGAGTSLFAGRRHRPWSLTTLCSWWPSAPWA